jgi:RNA-directed DNA polymerase
VGQFSIGNPDQFSTGSNNVRKYRGILLIMPSKKSVKALLAKVRETLKANKTARQANMIAMLNPLLRGWANYYRHVVAGRTFSKMDHQIWKALWRWVKRRHPHKGAGWLLKRYFIAEPGRKWWFAARLNEKKRKWLELYQLSSSSIVRHIKVKGEANPFDPRWELYFEGREERRMRVALSGRPWTLWRRQKGRCSVCREMITTETDWHMHHVIWRIKWRQRPARQSRSAPSQLPSPSSQSENPVAAPSASRRYCRGLSRMRRKSQVRF